MGVKKITESIDEILTKKKRVRAKRAGTLAKLLTKLENKRGKLKKKLSEVKDNAQARKLKGRLRATELYLAKGRRELDKLK